MKIKLKITNSRGEITEINSKASLKIVAYTGHNQHLCQINLSSSPLHGGGRYIAQFIDKDDKLINQTSNRQCEATKQ